MFESLVRRVREGWCSFEARLAGRRIPQRLLGRMGERRAAWFYRLRGYRIAGRNIRFPDGEIDLVVRRGRMVVIAEVKTRQSRTAGEGYDAVDRRKREQLVRLADRYLAGSRPAELRYDVLSLYWTGRRFVVSHFADAFRPTSDARRPWQWRA
ncbi:MAG: YraN family protein [Thermoanaerobaculia bacterium]